MPVFTYTALASSAMSSARDLASLCGGCVLSDVHRMINSSCDEQDIVVSVRGLEVVRGGNRVLCGINMDIPAGQIVRLLGPSGCGKTTLMRAIVGVQRSARPGTRGRRCAAERPGRLCDTTALCLRGPEPTGESGVLLPLDASRSALGGRDCRTSGTG